MFEISCEEQLLISADHSCWASGTFKHDLMQRFRIALYQEIDHASALFSSLVIRRSKLIYAWFGLQIWLRRCVRQILVPLRSRAELASMHVTAVSRLSSPQGLWGNNFKAEGWLVGRCGG